MPSRVLASSYSKKKQPRSQTIYTQSHRVAMLSRSCSRRTTFVLGKKYITFRYLATKTNSASPLSLVQEIAARQKLYITDPISPGSIFFLPNGTKIFNKLIQFMKLQQQQQSFQYQEVITPLIYKRSLWEKSGHWQNYQDDMFKVDGTDVSKETYGLKPMNCPGHCVMFNRFDHSYQELPIRYTDFSPLHRNEASGALSGLTRLRKFHQDDGHIFCTKDQIY